MVRVIIPLLLLVIAAAGFSQAGVSLSTEIQSIEKSMEGQGIPDLQRHNALVRLAQLRQLSGDIEGAARNWLEAAAAVPGSVDDQALLNCAYCLAAMGEWDRASAALQPLLLRYIRARFLYISINAISTGDLTELISLTDNPEYSNLRAEIFFILWKISHTASSERWRQRLLNEYPQTPEGLLAAGRSSAIMVNPSPFWLFAGGLDSLALISSGSSTTTNAAQTSVSHNSVSVSQFTDIIRLQTGIFSRQTNAQAHMTNLIRSGFIPSIEQRIVNGNEMWVVTVSAGADANRTLSELRTAGFEAFSVR
ncbi:MAG: hypothetical protein FWC06_03375 [Treponema sp.]|nr:hypothetical protein [Treponema sp.]